MLPKNSIPACFVTRARLQSGRNRCKMLAGFSPCYASEICFAFFSDPQPLQSCRKRRKINAAF